MASQDEWVRLAMNAQAGDEEAALALLRLLRRAGQTVDPHEIPWPHTYDCGCDDCVPVECLRCPHRREYIEG